MPAKDIVQDNWANVLSIGASIGDELLKGETKVNMNDLLGNQISVAGIGIGIGAVGTVFDVIMTAKSKQKWIANPKFVQNGFGDLDSPRTKTYFKHRKGKKIAGAIFSFAGSVGATFTGVNVAGIARHGRAEANTVAHLMHILAEARRMKQSKYFVDLLSTLAKCKAIKLTARGGALAADSIPGCAIASSAISAITGLAGSLGMKGMDPLATIASVELHWRAFQEQKLAGAFGGTGPAMRIVHHLYTGILSEHHFVGVMPKEFIAEPMGWMVIKDKMTLI